MARTKMQRKVAGAAVKYCPEGMRIQIVRQDGKWHAITVHGGLKAEAEATGLMDVLSKLCGKWHKAAGTDLKGLVLSEKPT